MLAGGVVRTSSVELRRRTLPQGFRRPAPMPARRRWRGVRAGGLRRDDEEAMYSDSCDLSIRGPRRALSHDAGRGARRLTRPRRCPDDVEHAVDHSAPRPGPADRTDRPGRTPGLRRAAGSARAAGPRRSSAPGRPGPFRSSGQHRRPRPVTRGGRRCTAGPMVRRRGGRTVHHLAPRPCVPDDPGRRPRGASARRSGRECPGTAAGPRTASPRKRHEGR